MNKNYIVNEIKKSLGEDYEVKFNTVQKNNVTKEAISIKKDGSDVAANIYYDKNADDDKIICSVIDTYKSTQNDDTQEITDCVNNIKDWDWVKTRVVPVMFNTEMNDASSFTTRKFIGDIGVSFRIMFKGASVKVLDRMLDSWGVDVDTLYEVAKENLNNKLFVGNMSSILFGLQFGDDSMKKRRVKHIDEPMGVIGTTDKMYGASAILLIPDLIKNGELEKKNYIVIPSSIHECILVEDGMRNDINGMIRMVNANEVAPEEVLSDSGLIYNADTEEFEVIAA